MWVFWYGSPGSLVDGPIKLPHKRVKTPRSSRLCWSIKNKFLSHTLGLHSFLNINGRDIPPTVVGDLDLDLSPCRVLPCWWKVWVNHVQFASNCLPLLLALAYTLSVFGLALFLVNCFIIFLCVLCLFCVCQHVSKSFRVFIITC